MSAVAACSPDIIARHGETLADHGARLTNVEKEVVSVRGRIDWILYTTILTLLAAVGGLLKLLHG
jgi:hypothetical protein